MLSRLFPSRRSSPLTDAPSVPEGVRVYAIGDVHGRLDLLRGLLDMIIADDRSRCPAQSQIIFLGDLIDRGPHSREVIDLVMNLSRSGLHARFLTGNHEEVFLKSLTQPSETVTRFFYRIGGMETILSYGLDRAELGQMSMAELTATLPGLVPQAHVDFLRGFEEQIVLGDYVFVHAGIRPDVPLSEQDERDLRWIREEFTQHPGALEKVVVHGHTVSDNVQQTRWRIGIDTGAWKSNVLTAIGLEGSGRWFLDTASMDMEKPAPVL